MNTATRRRPIESLIAVGFGTIWMLVGTLSLVRGERSAGGSAVLVVALVLAVAVARSERRTAERRIDRKWMVWAFGAEITGIVAAAVAGIVMGRPHVILPLIGVAVGLHFLPLSRAFHKPLLVGTGGLMTAVAIGSLLSDVPGRWAVLGFGVGICLWGTVLADRFGRWRVRP